MTELPVFEHLNTHLLAQLDDTSRHVDILSPSLDIDVFATESVIERLTRLVRRGRMTRIRIITGDIRPLIEQGHPLLSLAKRLPSATHVKVLAEHPEWQGESLALCDRSSGISYHVAQKRWAVIDSRAEARRLAEHFDRLWLSAADSPEVRQF